MNVNRRRFRYFYLNGKLHKLLRVNRGRDEAVSWCYSEHSRRIYQWSHVQKYGSRGFTIGEVSEIIGRTTRMIKYYIEWGLINQPEKTYSLTTGVTGMAIFSTEDLFKIREVAAGMHTGRPRKDGMHNNRRTITEQEVYALTKHDITLYAKNKNGEFVPLYMAEEW